MGCRRGVIYHVPPLCDWQITTVRFDGERDESRPYGFLTTKHSIFKLNPIVCKTPCFGTFSQQKVCKPLTIYLVFLGLDDMISTG